MKHPLKLYITVILLWFIARGTQCGDRHTDNCGDYKTDTSYFSVDIINAAPVYHTHDSIKFYSKISDNIQSQSGNTFTHAFNSLSAYIQAYKVISVGSLYQMNYANNEFNPYVTTGLFDNTGSFGNKILFQRVEPYNTLEGGYICGDTGLYIIVVNLSNDFGPQNIQFYVGNDHCTSYQGFSSIPEVKQNKQYWDSVGLTTLTLANSNYGELVNKPDRNYVFVNVLP